MKWASAISQEARLEPALRDCIRQVTAQLGDSAVDFAALFVSQAFAEHYDQAPSYLLDRLPCKVLVGASAGGVIGGGREVENNQGVSLVAAHLPGVKIKTFSVQEEDLPDLDAPPRAWESLVGARAAEDPQFVMIADPFTVHAENFLAGLDYAFPKSAKLGGLASGAQEAGKNALYLNNICQRAGIVGAVFTGDVKLDVIVAQGCRPIGRPYRITGCEDNVLAGLEGKPPLEVLQDVFRSLSERDKQLLRQSLFLGINMNSAKEKPVAGDFLIRNIVGVDNERGLLAIGAPLRAGQLVQFHLRDGETSAHDLEEVFNHAGPAVSTATRGAMLFSCVGRGEALYGKPHHDSRFFLQRVGPVPLGGFFCNGEIGPVGGTTYVHGYTSCFGLFRPKNSEARP